MIHLYSGEGRGKTSIAIGTAIRMAGAGKKVIFSQFMKGRESSELAILKTLSEITIYHVAEDFPFYSRMKEEQKERLTKYHNEILEEIISVVNKYRTQDMQIEELEPQLLVVMDEITYPYCWNLIDQEKLESFLKSVPKNVEVIMTGRNPSACMIDVCDYWSELSMKRHPYENGVTARYGVEF